MATPLLGIFRFANYTKQRKVFVKRAWSGPCWSASSAPGNPLAQPRASKRVDYVAEHRVPDIGWLHPRPADRLPHHRRGQVTGWHRREAAAVLADRGPRRGQDEYLTLAGVHGSSAHMSMPPLT